MSKPAVSIILPTYNRSARLKRSIRSVLAQTYREFELIVVDDGSNDDTEEVVRSFGDPRIKYLKQVHRGSAAIARNVGIRASSAPLIAFQDSDDEWLIDKLSIQIAAMDKVDHDVALICGGYLIFSGPNNTQYVGPDRRMQAADWSNDNIYDFSFITPTWLMRREVLENIGLFDESMFNLEDWELVFRIFPKYRIIALNAPLVIKHASKDSINANPQSRISSLERIIDKHCDLWREQPQVMAKLYEELGRWQCRHGEVNKGRESLSCSLRLQPTSFKRWGLWSASLLGGRCYNRIYQIRRSVLR